MPTYGRLDDNHAEIVDFLRSIPGVSVQSLASVAFGCPDLLIGYQDINYLAEVKDGRKPPSKRRLTPAEVKWHEDWTGQKAIIKSVEDAAALLGIEVN